MASTGILPTHQRYINGAHIPSSVRRSFRPREKYLIILVFFTFGVVCFGGFFFLPEFKSGTSSSSVYTVYQQIQKAGPDLLFPPPPRMDELGGNVGKLGIYRHGHYIDHEDPHGLEDKAKLEARIREDQEMERKNPKVLERPDVSVNVKSSSSSTKDEETQQKLFVETVAPVVQESDKIVTVPPSYSDHYPVLQKGEDPDPIARQRRNKVLEMAGSRLSWGVRWVLLLGLALLGVTLYPLAWSSGPVTSYARRRVLRAAGPLLISRNSTDPPDSLWAERRRHVVQMTKHAWDNYVRYAWGKNELRPLSKKGHSGSIFGSASLGATIVDGLDTLYIMGLQEEFKQGRAWIQENLTFDNLSGDFSVFETNIRYVGGLLTCYAFTGDVMFRDKAEYIAKRLLPAFQTRTGVPYSLINFKTGLSKNYGWASGGSSILSEIGTLHLEFVYLSDVTGNPVFREKVENIRSVLQGMEKPKGLYPNYLNPKTGKWGQNHMSMGALGDSFYEYLLKAWIQSGKQDNEAREMYDQAIEAVLQHMLQTSPGGLMYFSDMKFDRLEHKMDHLACFSGGLLALGAKEENSPVSSHHMEVAAGITNTCHESYARTYTKLGPENFRFTDAVEAKAVRTTEKHYLLRPEVIESYFYMWRLTKDQKYREWGWEAVQALEKYCRTPGGYSGLKNVYQEDPIKDDVQQSFFLAETLKYLYLLFSNDSLISLDEWVFNTEAHPLPIKGANPYYREHTSVVY